MREDFVAVFGEFEVLALGVEMIFGWDQGSFNSGCWCCHGDKRED